MTTGKDDRLLRLAEMMAEGIPVDWDELRREDPELAASVDRFRELEALSTAHRNASQEIGQIADRTVSAPREQPLFLWGDIQALEKIGEGGFSEVYRAWDPGLQQEVALKLPRSDAALSEDAVQRWLDEARRLARVRHTNVVAVHWVDVRNGRPGFWMDLIHGRTLEALLEQGRLGGDEAALIGVELCRALAAVHAVNLVHGDIKSFNVMREGSRAGSPASGAGRIVLMDFGASGESSPVVARGARFVSRLSTAPEVLRGEPPWRQSDLYSLGVLMYRLLTGRYPIESDDPITLEAMIQCGARKPLRDLRPDLGAALVAVVERALETDISRRFSSAGEMERALSAAMSPNPPIDSTQDRKNNDAVPEPPRPRRRTPLLIAAALIVIGASVTAWWIDRPKPPPIHFTIGPPPRKLLRTDPNNFAMSPDGSTLAFVAFDSTGQSLWVRQLGNYQPRELADTRGATFPFWSPDGKDLGFFARGKMRRVPLDGGEAEVICDAPSPHGGTWSAKDVIVFAPANGALFRVPASGGIPESVTTVATGHGVNAHAWPSFLPDNEHFTYVARRIEPFLNDDPPRPGPWTSYVGSIRTRESQPLLTANSAAMFAHPHQVLFIRNDVLYAQDFDQRSLRVNGTPRRIADTPAPVSILGSRCGSASRNGVLAWQSRGSFKTRLAWIDRQGRPIGNLAIQPDRWFRLIMSPDGSRAVLRKDEENGSSLWLLDLERESVSRLTSGPDAEDPGVWSPDGKEILYSLRGPGGVCDVRRMTVDQPETDRSFYRSSGFLQNAYGWSPDGRWVLIQDMRKESDFDLVLVSARDGATRPYLATPSAERRAVISPDGQWVLYLTNESGVPQACVRSFSAPAVERVVSPVPLFAALWSKHGREILLMGRDFRLRSVAVEGGKTLRLGTPQELFALPSDIRGLAPTPDGERFLILEPELRTSPEPAIEVSVNWMAGLQP